MKHSITHSLSDDLAKLATEKAFASYAERFSDYDPTAEWITDRRAEVSFSAKGIELGGTITLKPGEVELEMSVPFAFKIFQKRAVAIIDEEISRWLEKAKSGEFDDELQA